ncbi:Ig-like domain-containing protein [Paenibacillus sp. NPDC056579]|uniref:Ig-like domain-containing protein n=1 Tax=Paenibacillus sp. NPDC056579 TaxID=3345871 RepID=UPI0036856A46
MGELRREISKLLVGTMLLSQLLLAFWGVTDSGGNRAFAAEMPGSSAEGQVTGTPKESAADTGLTDISGSYAAKEIVALYEAGIVSGYGEGRFAPEQSMTRAELAKIIVLSLGLKEEPQGADRFQDIAQDSWYRGFVGALVISGITEGTSENAFSPAEKVTREQLVVFFLRAMGLQSVLDKASSSSKAAFTDWEQIADWAKPSVWLANQIGFVQGIDNGNGSLRFEPSAAAQRQALARLAYEFHTKRQQYVDAAQKLVAEPVKEEEEEVKKEETPIICCAGGGGGGGGGSSSGGGNSAGSPLNKPGTINGDAAITSSGTYGPSDGQEGVKVSGTLVVNPGANGEVTLQNVTAAKIEVRSGSANTIRVRNVRSDVLLVKANQQTSGVRILSLDGTSFTNTEIDSQAVVEQEAGSLGAIRITQGAANQTVTLRGTFNGEVSVDATGVRLSVGSTSSGKSSSIQRVSLKSNASLNVAENNSIQSVSVSQNGIHVALAGRGSYGIVNFANVHGVTANIQTDTISLLSLDNAIIKLEGKPESFTKTAAEYTGSSHIEADAAVREALKKSTVAKIIATIDSIGDSKEYSSELEQLIQRIYRMITAAYDLGATESDISNYPKLKEKELDSAKAALEEAKQLLQIMYKPGDTADHVTQNITLPTSGVGNSSISWELSDSQYLTLAGIVTRPAAGEADHVVKLTATLSSKGISVYKLFSITIKALPSSGTEPTNTPTVLSSVYSDAAWITVMTEANAKVVVTDQQGGLAGKGTARNDGSLVVPLRKQLTSNEQLFVVAEGSGKLPSAAATVTVQRANAPTVITAMPELIEEIYEGTSTLQVFTFEPSVVWLQLADGTVLDAKFYEGNHYYSGSYPTFDSNQGSSGGGGGIVVGGGGGSISESISVDIPLTIGQQLQLISRSNGKKPSGAVTKTVKAYEGKTDKPAILGGLYEGDSYLQVEAERRADVTIAANNVEQLDKEVIYTNESTVVYRFRLMGQKAGDQVRIIAKSPGKSASEITETVITGTEPSSKPYVYKENSKNWTTEWEVKGVTSNDAIVHIKDRQGNLLYYADARLYVSVGDYWLFSYSYSHDPNAPVETLYVTTFEYGKSESEPVPVSVQRRKRGFTDVETPTTQTQKPEIEVEQIYPSGGILIFRPWPADRKLTVTTSAGVSIAEIILKANETRVDLEISEWLALKTNDFIYITAKLEDRSVSDPIYVSIKSETNSPLIKNASIEFDGYQMKIRGNTAVSSTLLVKKVKDGKVILGPVSNSNTSFQYDVPIEKLIELNAGDELEFTAVRDNQTDSLYAKVPNNITKTASIMPDSMFYENGAVIKPNSGIIRIVIKDDLGHVVAAYSSNAFLTNSFRFSKHLNVYVQEYGKLLSDPISVTVQPVQGTSLSPTNLSTLYEDTRSITVRMQQEGYYRAVIRGQDGLVIGAGNYRYGSFLIDEFYRPLRENETLSVRISEVGKGESTKVSVIVEKSKVGKAPVVVGSVYSESEFVRVQTDQPGMVIISDDEGYVIADPFYKIQLGVNTADFIIIGPLKEGTQLYIQNKISGMQISSKTPVDILPSPYTDTPSVTGAVYDIPGRSVTVSAEKESTIFLKKQDGKMIGQGYVGYSGDPNSISYDGQQLVAGEKILVTAKVKGKKESLPSPMIVQEAPLTKTPSVTGTVNSESYTISGIAEAGALVKIVNSMGQKLYDSSYAGSLGHFTLYVWGTLPTNDKIYLIAKVPDKKESIPSLIPVLEAPLTNIPTINGVIYSESRTITGYAEPNAQVRLINASGQETTNSRAQNDGQFTLYISESWIPLDGTLRLLAKVPDKKESLPYTIQVVKSPKAAIPTVNGAVYEDGINITWTIDPYNNLKFKTMSEGAMIYPQYHDGFNGTYYGIYFGDFSLGTQVAVTSKPEGSSESDPAILTVKPVSGKTSLPTVTGSVYQSFSSLNVKTEPFTMITIYTPAGKYYQLISDYWGNAYVNLSYYPNFPLNQEISITADAIGKAESDPVRIYVKPNP